MNVQLRPTRYKHRMRRKVRLDLGDLQGFATDALNEGFVRGSYKLPRKVRRFLKRPMEAYAGRPRMKIAIETLATIVGCYHTGSRNFVVRGCAIGPEGAGFFLCRQGLARVFGGLNFTEALIREATAFLIRIGFIERVSPVGELVEVRKPKNSTNPRGYFRTAVKAKKDQYGRIRTPKTLYRLARATRQLFAERLSPNEKAKLYVNGKPLWIIPDENLGDEPCKTVEGVHRGCAPYDVAGHDPNDPRFDRHEVDPLNDPFERPRFSPGEVSEANAFLDACLARQRFPEAEWEARGIAPKKIVGW